MSDQIHKDAEISKCGRYRYVLLRLWDLFAPPTMFIMLNPSTADASADDPTIRKCMAFARTWKTGGIWVVNLFALRATNPRMLSQAADPVGPGNDGWIKAAIVVAKPRHIVCAWGKDGRFQSRDATVMRLLEGKAVLSALQINKDGTPAHPLYLPGSLKPAPYKL